MTRTTLLALLLLAIAAVAIARRRLRFVVPLEPDPYAEPVPMTAWPQNSATYLYNARTGVLTSYN